MVWLFGSGKTTHDGCTPVLKQVRLGYGLDSPPIARVLQNDDIKISPQ
jgi:hypothetical protein